MAAHFWSDDPRVLIPQTLSDFDVRSGSENQRLNAYTRIGVCMGLMTSVISVAMRRPGVITGIAIIALTLILTAMQQIAPEQVGLTNFETRNAASYVPQSCAKASQSNPWGNQIPFDNEIKCRVNPTTAQKRESEYKTIAPGSLPVRAYQVPDRITGYEDMLNWMYSKAALRDAIPERTFT